MDIGTFMEIVLCHPAFGYYTTRDPFGAGGDFTTAPEISQIFGEVMGLWLADAWVKAGRPDPILLVECGPGRGTLMADVLRATRKIPGFSNAARVHLIESSPFLRARQAEALADFTPVFHDRIERLPTGPVFLIANEFLDALPVRQYRRTESGWAERRVTLDDAQHFRFVEEASPEDNEALSDRARTTTPGAMVEISPAREDFLLHVANRVRQAGGAALFIDYGSERSGFGDTLQALRAHRPVDVLDCVGEADLTTQVDFEPLVRVARTADVQVAPVVDQGLFLTRMGGALRLEALCRARPDRAQDLRAGFARLTAPEAMGRLFKVLGLWHGLDGFPEGFS